MGERIKKSIINAEVNLFFYFIVIILSFFSRKIFLECLGAEFIGLSGTLSSIIGYLNLAEFGIGSCISFYLYKPLQQNNHKEIQELLSIFGYLYRWIGFIILAIGIAISCFFPWIFGSATIPMGIVYFAFYALIGSSLIGYFINYRQLLLTADQKNYLVAIYTQTGSILKTILQIFLAYYYKNLYIWVSVEFLFSIFVCIILNWKIDTEYLWLKTDKSKGKILLKKRPGILKNTKQIFIHKMKDVILMRSDELFVFLFVSLKMVAYYGNYTLIISRIGQFFSAILDSINAGIGNLIAEGNKQNIMKVFWEALNIRHFVAGFLCFSIFHFIEPFITLWLGTEYVLDRQILLMLCVYIYIDTSRGVVDMFNHAHGLYADVWAAWAELFLFVSITLIAGYHWGIKGILLGKIVSTSLIIVLWKPYYLFKSGLDEHYSIYWKGVARNFFTSMVSLIFAHYILSMLPLNPILGYFTFLFYCITGILIFLIINIPLLILLCKGSKDSIHRVLSIMKHKNHS